MTQTKQQELMMRLARCKFVDDADSYEEADCMGVMRLILRDYGGMDLPNDRQKWPERFKLLVWPTELAEFDVLIMACLNQLGVADHVATHIGNGWLVHIGRRTGGVLCDRVNRYGGKILNVLRYNK